MTQPGGQEILPRALCAVAGGERSIMRFHELRYASLPPAPALHELLAGLEASVLTLLGLAAPGAA